MKKHLFWWLLLFGLIIVLLGVFLRISEPNSFNATLIVLGVLAEIIAVIVLITKAFKKS